MNSLTTKCFDSFEQAAASQNAGSESVEQDSIERLKLAALAYAGDRRDPDNIVELVDAVLEYASIEP